jgi:uncharacterized protein (TIGR00661 family)
MKILYGVQGTGNGHVTRARIMAKAFDAAGVDVDWVFSGRKRDDFFDMDIFGSFQCYRGLTFETKSGKILYLKTAATTNLWQLQKDIKKINVEGYDLIINDFEPVSAWAAKRAGKKVLGISHQNAFLYDIPKEGNNIFTDLLMRYFAPVTQAVGLHWHHFNQPILPPLIEPSHYPNTVTHKHYVVYLPFASLDDIVPQLTAFYDCQFYVFAPVPNAYDQGHIHVRPLSREGFQAELHRCEGVICSAGFELPSEAIQLGKKILVQPVAGQMEQQSNALALAKLGLGTRTTSLDVETLGKWLTSKTTPAPHNYPNVAKALVNWIKQGATQDISELQKELWQQTINTNLHSTDLFHLKEAI